MKNFTGQTICGSEIGELIGEGGFAQIYRARQTKFGRDVAVKVMSLHVKDEVPFLIDFKFEAELAAKLEHPHIVAIYDYCEQDGYAYLVMQLLEGGTLRERIDKGKMPPNDALEIFQMIASALEFSHQLGYVHRDMKPENILFDNNGFPYIADFGLARRTDTDIGDRIEGTPMYMSPEQSRSEPSAPANDIYSMGIMLYEMLAGRHPYGNVESLTEILIKVQHENLPLISTMSTELSYDVDEIIQKLTDKQSEKRYQTLREAVIDLTYALKSDITEEIPIIDNLFEFELTDIGQQIQQIVIDYLKQNEDRLFELLNNSSVAPSTGIHEQISQVKLKQSFLLDGLQRLNTHIPLNVPQRLQIPPLPDHKLLDIQERFDNVKNLVLEHKSVVLLGPSGVGKSVLAYSVARHDEIKQTYADHIVYLSLGAQTDSFSLIASVLSAYGIDQEQTADLELDDLKLFLADTINSPLLIVVDDVNDASPLKSAFNSVESKVTFIVTTRESNVAVDTRYRRIDVDAFDLEKRFEFLNELLPDIDLNILGEEATQFLNNIGGLPRDIKMIGAALDYARHDKNRLKETMQSIQQILTDILEPSFDIFKLTIDEFEEEVRNSLRDLAILPPEPSSFSKDAAQHITQSIVSLYRLVDASLLKSLVADGTDTSRYMMYPTIAEFSRKALPEPQDSSVYQRVIEFFMNYIRDHNTDFPNLTHERANLEKVLEITQKSFLQEFVECALLLHPYLVAIGQIDKATENIDHALKHVDDSHMTVAQHAKLLLNRAEIALYIGNQEDALELVVQGLKIVERADPTPENNRVKASLSIQLGRRFVEIGKFDEALAVLAQVRALLIEQGDHLRISEVLNISGTAIIYKTGDPEQAIKCFNESLYQAKLADNKYRMSNVLTNIASLERQHLNQQESAWKHLEEALKYARDIRHLESISNILMTQGQIDMALGRIAAAEVKFKLAVEKAKESFNSKFIAGALLLQANFYAENKEYKKAESTFAEAFAIVDRIKNPTLALDMVDYLFKTGAYRIINQELDFDARIWYRVQQSLDAFDLPDENVERFTKTHDRLINRADTQGSNEAMFEACYLLGLLERDDFNDVDLALTHFQNAMKHAKAWNDPTILMVVYEALIQTQLMLGDFDNAERNLAQFMTNPALNRARISDQVTQLLTSILDAREEEKMPNIHRRTGQTLIEELPKYTGDEVLIDRLISMFDKWSK